MRGSDGQLHSTTLVASPLYDAADNATQELGGSGGSPPARPGDREARGADVGIAGPDPRVAKEASVE
jgi:hypothetical protein